MRIISRLLPLTFLLIAAACSEQTPPSAAKPTIPTDPRVVELLGKMTLQEKVAQITGFWQSNLGRSVEDGSLFSPESMKRQFPDGVGSIGPMQLSLENDVKYRNAVQKFLKENTRLGIPAMFHDEGCHGVMKPEATSFPNPLGLACSWDPELIQRIFDAVAREMRARGGQHSLTPILDVARDPRWGRIEETMGEDPYINSILGAAMVEGLQGSSDGTIDGDHVMSTLKHFAGHGTPEGGLNRSPAIAGIRELREVHFAPFQYVIKNAHPAAVMASYNEIDGLPSHANRWLLQDLLRGEFGFKGLIVSDYTGIEFLETAHHVAKDKPDAARLAMAAGIEIELPSKYAYPSLEQCLADKTVTMQQIDAVTGDILEAKFKLGLFDDPYVDLDKAKAAIHDPQHQALALKAAEESMVLLKNDQAALPLSTDKYKKIAVIGPNANIARLGGYSGIPIHSVSILDGVRTRVGDQAQVSYAQGCVLVKNEPATAGERWRVDRVVMATDEENAPLIDEAKKAAADADVVILCIGETESLCRESWGGTHLGDSTTLELPGSQPALLQAVLSTGKPVIAYLMNGRPLAINELKARANAIIEGFYMGQETGTAVAEVLFGDVSPSGKLTTSFPKSVGQLPVYYSRKPGAAKYPYQFADTNALFPFGFGLSYTTFSYANPKLKDASITPDGRTVAMIDVTNTGQREADEIVQMYVRDEASSVTQPVKLLKGFKRIHLKPGETRTVEFPIATEALAHWDSEMKYRVEPGTFRITLGPSSATGQNVTLKVAQ